MDVVQKLQDKGYIVLQNAMGDNILYYKGNVIFSSQEEHEFFDYLERYEKEISEE